MKLRLRKKLADKVDCAHLHSFSTCYNDVVDECKAKGCDCLLKYEECKCYATNKTMQKMVRNQDKHNRKVAQNDRLRERETKELFDKLDILDL